VKYTSELLQLGGERHLSHRTLAGDFKKTQAYQFNKGTLDTLLGLGN
jgi:hypothetical protein